MEVAVALNVPCSTLLPGGLATACLQAIGAVAANGVVAAATFIAIDEAGDEVEEDDDAEDLVESVRADVVNALFRVSDSFSSHW